MRRFSSQRKSHQGLPNSQLSGMVNAILFANQGADEHCTFLTVSAPPQKSKTKEEKVQCLVQQKEPNQKKLQIFTSTPLNGFQFKSESIDRKALRPRSSLVGSKYYQTLKTPTRQKIGEEIKISSAKRSDDKKSIERNVEYKMAETEAEMQKLVSKPPKSLTSTKPLGLVRGYSVNSHKFYIRNSQISETRILVVANLTKATKPECMISLFGMFQSNNSAVFVDFLRENFQVEICRLLEGSPVPQIRKQLIQRCLMRIEDKFYNYYKIKPRSSRKGLITNNFGLSYSLVFSSFDELVIFTRGSSRVNISSMFGAKMNCMSSSTLQMRVYQLQEAENLDFIVLASKIGNYIGEGAAGASKNIQREIWFSILNTISSADWKNSFSEGQEFHSLLGGVVDSLMGSFNGVMSYKNMSVILCGMANLEDIISLRCCEQLQIPFTEVSPLSIPQKETERDDFQQQ